MEGLSWWSSGEESAFDARDASLIPCLGTKILHTAEQLRCCAPTREAFGPQGKILPTPTKTRQSQKKKREGVLV